MENPKYAFLFIILLGVVAFMLIREFITSILSAFVLSYLLLPLHKLMSRKLPRKLSAIIAVLILVAVLFLVIYYFTSTAVAQAQAYLTQETIEGIFSTFLSWIPEIPVANYIGSISSVIRGYVVGLSLSIISQIPHITLSILVTLFLTYYLILNWQKTTDFLVKLIPIRNKKEVAAKVGLSARKIVYGYTIIAAFDFIIALIGFKEAGIELAVFLALLIGVSAFIPFFGPASVWLPVFLFNILRQNYFSAITILITGLIISVFVDNLLSYVLVGRQSDINPAFMLLGVFGGVAYFGILGFIIGPLI